MKASKARLLSKAEARRKEKQQELVTKKMHAVREEICEPEPVTAAVTSRCSREGCSTQSPAGIGNGGDRTKSETRIGK